MPNDINKLRRLMKSAHIIRNVAPERSWGENLKMAWTEEKLLQEMSNGIVVFCYYKKDGSIRDAVGTTSPRIIPDRAKPISIPESGTKQVFAAHAYFDIMTGNWRSFSAGSLIGVNLFYELKNE